MVKKFTAEIINSEENMEQLSGRVSILEGCDGLGICITRTSTFYRALRYHGYEVLVHT